MSCAAIEKGTTLVTRDDTTIYFEGWGSGQPVVFSHVCFARARGACTVRKGSDSMEC